VTGGIAIAAVTSATPGGQAWVRSLMALQGRAVEAAQVGQVDEWSLLVSPPTATPPSGDSGGADPGPQTAVATSEEDALTLPDGSIGLAAQPPTASAQALAAAYRVWGVRSRWARGVSRLRAPEASLAPVYELLRAWRQCLRGPMEAVSARTAALQDTLGQLPAVLCMPTGVEQPLQTLLVRLPDFSPPSDSAGESVQRTVDVLSTALASRQESVQAALATVSARVEQYVLGPQFEAAADREVRALLESGQVRAAASIAGWASSKRPDSERLCRWDSLLNPPPPRTAGPASGRSRRPEHAWLRRHAAGYQGQWVALTGDRLVAAGPDLSEVRSRVRSAGCAEGVLLHFVPKGPQR